MANQLLACITLKDSDHKKMIFALAPANLDADFSFTFIGSAISVAGATIDYKVESKPGEEAGTKYITYQVPLHIEYTHPNFPNNHRVTVRLFDPDDKILGVQFMDTKDSPILR